MLHGLLVCCLVTGRAYLEAALGADAEWLRWSQRAAQARVGLAGKQWFIL